MLWWTYQQLRMGNAGSRLAVVEKLVASGDDNAVGPLIFALKDKESTVRCAAAKALMKFQDRRAVEPLVLMLRDTEPLARAAAAETLGHLGDPVAVNHLVGFLRDGDPIVRTIAARSLDRLGWKPGTDSHRVLQILAMGNLQQLISLGPEGVSSLLELLRSGPPNKQFSAVKALGEISDPRVRPAMLEALKKPSTAVRIAALGVLERMADPTTYPDVERLLHDSNPSVRAAAVETATRCGGTQAVPALIRCLKDHSWEVRQATANVLGQLGDRSAVDALCALVTDHDRDVRESVINALSALNDRRAVPSLVLALLDLETPVRALAESTLLKLDRRWDQSEAARSVVPVVVGVLEHQDYWVRFHAGKLLQRLKIDPLNPPKESVRPALEKKPDQSPEEPVPAHPAAAILADLLFDRDRDLRLAAANALGNVRDKSTSSLLTAALRDVDFTVQEAAKSALAALN